MFEVYGFIAICAFYCAAYFIATKFRDRYLANKVKKIYYSAREDYEKLFCEEVNKKTKQQESTMTYVEYRGYKIPMTVYEKKNIWDSLSRTGKNNALSDWKKHLENQKQ